MESELTGTIQEMCLFPEYEYLVRLTLPQKMIDDERMSYFMQEINTAPAYNYRAWYEQHNYDDELTVYRAVLTSPPHLSLPEKLIGELLIRVTEDNENPILNDKDTALKAFTLKVLKDIEV